MLAAAQALLIVENDTDVDWEVDQDALATTHPHRERLQAAWRAQHRRRPGAMPAPAQICLSPVAERTGHRQSPATMRVYDGPASASTRRTADCSGCTH